MCNILFWDWKMEIPRVYTESLDGDLELNPFVDELVSRRLSEVARVESLEAAAALKKILLNNNLNVVTAESLTAGMIAKTLVDIPGGGATVYGGYVVYDTDAKRQFIQVATKGVYSILTAQQMAAGALERSRAMVGLAVSGDAMPFPQHKDNLGKVYIGVALRLENEILAYGKEIAVCSRKEVKGVCEAWQSLNVTGDHPKYPPYQFTSMIADYIRMRTVTDACIEAVVSIQDALDRALVWGRPPTAAYDTVCSPSWIIGFNVYPNSNPNQECSGQDTSSIYE